MDPQHRGLMECAYHALENAGVALERIADSNTGVFCGSFTDDYRISTYKDVATMPKHAATGLGQNFTANRLSWAFNLKGLSLQIDTACSSSLTALDVACQSLRSGDSDIVRVLHLCLRVVAWRVSVSPTLKRSVLTESQRSSERQH
jgi:acyl transferase domain-containing protein